MILKTVSTFVLISAALLFAIGCSKDNDNDNSSSFRLKSRTYHDTQGYHYNYNYEYDGDKLSRYYSTRYPVNDTLDILETKMEYSYPTDNTFESENFKKDPTGTWISEGKLKTEILRQGDILTRSKSYFDNGIWHVYSKDIVTYSGDQIMNIHYLNFEQNGDTAFQQKIDLEYQNNHLLTALRTSKTKDYNWSMELKEIVEYNGDMASRIIDQAYTEVYGQLSDYLMFNLSYEGGNLSHVVFYQKENNVWGPIYEEAEYLYDEHGNVKHVDCLYRGTQEITEDYVFESGKGNYEEIHKNYLNYTLGYFTPKITTYQSDYLEINSMREKVSSLN